MHDINKKSRGRRQSMPFYEQLFCFLTMDKVIATPHTDGTTRGYEELLAGTPPEEDMQKVPRTMEQLSAQKQGPRAHRAQGQWPPKYSGLMVLVIAGSGIRAAPAAGPELSWYLLRQC